MPNMCYSRLTVEGPQQQIDTLLAEIGLDRAAGETAKRYVESFTSEPKADAEIVHRRASRDAEATLCGRPITWPADDERDGEQDEDDGEEDDEDEPDVKFCRECDRRYDAAFGRLGYDERGMLSLNDILPVPDGLSDDEAYQWRIENWDTKWDLGASGSYIREERPGAITLALETAWSPPFGVIAELARRAPELTFHVSWSVEPPFGIDGDVGEARWRAGRRVLEPPRRA